MYNKIKNAVSLPGKLMAAVTLFTAFIFNTHFANAQANTKEQPVTEKEGVTRFEAKTTSQKEGAMKWTGMLKGDMIYGSAVQTKPDKTSVIYSFNGKVSSPAAKTHTKPEAKPAGN